MPTENTNTWRPNVGERVMVVATVRELGFSSDRPITVALEGNSRVRVWLSELAPLPTPRQPWDVLREAAEILVKKGHWSPNNYFLNALGGLADALEAAAAPKPPTLREALEACLAELHASHAQYGCKENAREHSAAIRAAEAALAREEGSA